MSDENDRTIQVDDDANIEVEMLVGFLPEHMQAVANELIDTCAKVQAADVCDRMYLMAKCVMEKRPDVSKDRLMQTLYTCTSRALISCEY